VRSFPLLREFGNVWRPWDSNVRAENPIVGPDVLRKALGCPIGLNEVPWFASSSADGGQNKNIEVRKLLTIEEYIPYLMRCRLAVGGR
jgi:hypothetical protein